MRADGFRPASRADDSSRRRFGRGLDAAVASIEEDERRRYGRPAPGAAAAPPAIEPVASLAPRHAQVERPAVERVGGGGRLFGRAGATLTAVGLVAVVAVVALAGAGFFEHLSPSPSPGPLVSFPGRVTWMQRLDAKQAVVLAGHNAYTTRDGGRTWRGGPLPIDRGAYGDTATATNGLTDPLGDVLTVPNSLSFVDADHGWLAAAPGAGGAFLQRGPFMGSGASGAAPTPDYSIAVYATSDGGRSWRGMTNPGVEGASIALQFVDREHGWLLAASPDATVASLRTADGGRTWSRLDVAESSGPWFRPAFASSGDGWMVEVLDALRFRVYHSGDAGATWSSTMVDVPALSPDEQVQEIGQPVVAGGVARVTVVTTAGGVPLVVPATSGSVSSGGSDGSSEIRLYPAFSAAGSYRVYTFRSDDAGSTWQIDRSADVPQISDQVVGSGQSAEPSERAWGLGSLVGTVPATIPYVTPASLPGPTRASFDEGVTWRTYETGALPGRVIDASWASPDDVWALVNLADGVSTGIYASSDGGTTWRPLLAAPPLEPPLASAAATSSPAMVSAVPQPSQSVAPEAGAPLRIGVAGADEVWEQRGGEFSWYVRRPDGGSWAGRSLPFTPDSVDAAGPDEFVIARQAEAYGDVPGNLFAEVEVAVSAWSDFNTARLRVPIVAIPASLAVTVHSPAWPRVSVFVDRRSDSLAQCLRFDSPDAGKTWGDGRPTPCMTGRTFTSRSAGHALADLGGGDAWAIATTTDGGATWRTSAANPPFDSGPAGKVAFVDSAGKAMYAGVYTLPLDAAAMEIVKSTDGGRTWAMDSAARANRATVLGPGHWMVFEVREAGSGLGMSAHETTDAGKTWRETRVDGLPAFESMQWADESTGYAVAPAVAPACGSDSGGAPSTCQSGWDTVYVTTDGGRTWSDVGGPMPGQ